MTRLLVATVLAGTLVIAGHAQPQAQSVVITGRVVSDETHEAIAHARVVVFNDATPLPPIFTDAQGRFASAMLARGRYRLTVTKAGFSESAVPRIDFRSAPAIEVRMPRSSAIEGRVFDANGEPLIGTAITVGVPRPGGEPTPVKTVGTDDLGHYRAGGLAAGTYVAVMSQLSVDDSGEVIRTPSFFPGVSTAADAEKLVLTPGEQKTGVDFIGTAGPALPFQVTSQLAVQPNIRISVGNPGRAATDTPEGTSMIRGRVTRTDGVPLARANVRAITLNVATGANAGRAPKSATTDEDGRYEIGELPRGSYRVQATKAGYAGSVYGQQADATSPPAPLAIADNEIHTQIDMTLPKFGAITGQVVDDFGDPVEGVAVSVSRLRFLDGRRRLTVAGAATQTTDDLGRYRIYGVAPASYVVAAMPGQLNTNGIGGNLSGFAPTYFPGTTSASEARLVTVPLAQDVSGIDLALIPLPTARVAGRRIGSDGLPLGGSLVLIPSQRSGAIVTPPEGARIESDGRFEFPNVTPGEYVIQADHGKSGQNAEGEFVSQFVTVNGADVTNVLLQATPGSTIRGRVVFDGDGPPPPLTFGIVPARADADRTPLSGGAIARAEVRPDLTFEILGVHGPRRLTIDRRPSGWDLKTVIANGVDVTDMALPFGRADDSLSDVQIVLSNQLTELSGTVSDARGNAATEYALLVFSTDPDRWYPGSRFMRRAAPAAAGNFTVRGLPPGDYYVAPVSGLSVLRDGANAWQDPEFLQTMTARATRAALADGQKLSITARLITP